MEYTTFAVILSADCLIMDKDYGLFLLDKHYSLPFHRHYAQVTNRFGEKFPALKIEKMVNTTVYNDSIRPQRYYSDFPLGRIALAVYEDSYGDVQIRMIQKNRDNTTLCEPEVDFEEYASDSGWDQSNIDNIKERLIGAFTELCKEYDMINRSSYKSNERLRELVQQVQEQYLDTIN